MDTSYILNQLGENRDDYFRAVSPPIMQTSNFAFNSVEQMRSTLHDELNTPFYTRGCNPTVTILRKKIAALEKAEDALIFGSGSAAISAAVTSQVKAGDHIICVSNSYSWTNKLLNNFLARFGVSNTMIDGRDPANYEAAIQPNTKLLFMESPNSMTFELQDIEAVVAIAKKHDLVTVMDNSYSSPLFQNPIEMGVDIVVHSATKYLSGHSDVVAGVLASSKTIIRQIFESEYMTWGGIISPNDAWLLLRGMRTLAIRMERVAKTTEKVINYLEAHSLVDKIHYPFLPSFPQYELAKKQMKSATGLFSIEVKAANLAQMEVFVNSLQHFLLACSWGGHESLIFPICVLYSSENYGSTTLPWNHIRLNIGLEDADVLIADIEQAFNLMTNY